MLPPIRRRAIIAQSLYAIATALSVFDTRISIAAIVLIQLNYALAPRLLFLHGSGPRFARTYETAASSDNFLPSE